MRCPAPSGRFCVRDGHHRSEGGTIGDKRVRVNDEIRISPIRLIAEDGDQLGIVSLDEARARAEEVGLDLVEVAPDSRPPVVKLMDYGKFLYQQSRAARDARKKQHRTQVKEVKFTPGIAGHDYEFKVRHARRFLSKGNKVRLTLTFRGRQQSRPERGLALLERVAEELADVSRVEGAPRREGRVVTMMLAPE